MSRRIKPRKKVVSLVMVAALLCIAAAYVSASYILAPAVRNLERLRPAGKRVPRFVWIILVYAMLLGLIGLFFTSFVPRLSNDLKRVLQETPAMMDQARKVWVPRVATWVEANFATEVEAEKVGANKGTGKVGAKKGTKASARWPSVAAVKNAPQLLVR